ncbi:hypothetical protein M501DRAFT_1001635 [Patellaria atrata CBS 101060]|uniref:Secreted protein n=1 Tax=Patellaria atrata CBS 101060 TaxID=1346257 RepID=A0A9P4VPA7_9PEZI|nr:hypothetical protein M501DRAFT_1001635 [Patellaria atrata CBS 101060]
MCSARSARSAIVTISLVRLLTLAIIRRHTELSLSPRGKVWRYTPSAVGPNLSSMTADTRFHNHISTRETKPC